MKVKIAFLAMFTMLLSFLPQFVFANSPGPNLDGNFTRSPGWIVGVVVIYCLIVAFNCLLEWVVSIPFQMHKECCKIILITNFVTQIAMHSLEVILFFLTTGTGGALYWMTVPFTIIALEIVVYITEFFVYRHKMLGFPTWSILLYTICANTASLVLGLLIIF